MRVDAHQHFWRYSPASHGWIDDSMAVLKRDFMPGDLKPLLHAAGFDACMAVQAQQDAAETEWLLQLADEHEFIAGVVGWVDLRSGRVGKDLARLSRHPKLRGIRHVVQDEPDDRFMLQPEFMRGIAALAEFRLAYDILIYARQLPAAVELVQAFPEQTFVLDHIGKPDIRSGAFDDWARGMAALTRNRNVYCKLSGMVTEADWSAWTAADFAPYMDVVFDWFGPERTMIGADWPVCTLAASYTDVIAVVTERLASMSQPDRDAVMGETAVRCYGLGA